MIGIPHLKVVAKVSAKVQESIDSPFKDVAFVCVQHVLETTVSLFESILNLGATPDSVFVLGKAYSTIPAIEAKLKTLGVYVQPSNRDLRGKFSAHIERDSAELW